VADVRRVDGSILRFDAGGTASLYVAEPSRAIVLNETATAVWDALGEPTTIDDIVDALAPRYDVGAADLRAGVVDVLRRLAAEGLVAIESEATSEPEAASEPEAEVTSEPDAASEPEGPSEPEDGR
jgi:hypothetical protein